MSKFFSPWSAALLCKGGGGACGRTRFRPERDFETRCGTFAVSARGKAGNSGQKKKRRFAMAVVRNFLALEQPTSKTLVAGNPPHGKVGH